MTANLNTGGNQITNAIGISGQTMIIEETKANNNIQLSDTKIQMTAPLVQIPSSILDMNNHNIQNVSDPIQLLDAVNKQYVDAVSSSIKVHASASSIQFNNVVAVYLNGGSGVGATLSGVGLFPSVDGYSVQVGE